MTFDEAIALLWDRRFRGSHETIDLPYALGRRLVDAITAPFPMPRYDNAAMDGYAVGSLRGPWRCIESVVAAGTVGPSIAPDGAARIFTGAPIPNGAVAVIAQENVRLEHGAVHGEAKDAENIRFAGEELTLGQVIATPGTTVTVGLISALASLGIVSISVETQPRIALLSTGSELASAGTELKNGQIFDSNRAALELALQEQRIKPTVHRIGDELEATCQAVARLLPDNDLCISIAGVSVGDRDFIRPAMERLGFEIIFSRIDMKPGRPVTFATKGNKAWLALPGNPMSALTTFALFGAAWLGHAPRWHREVIVEGIPGSSGRETFLPCRYEPGGVRILHGPGSHSVAGMVYAEGLARLPSGRDRFEVGDKIEVTRLPWRTE